jgi:hypothetical protein
MHVRQNRLSLYSPLSFSFSKALTTAAMFDLKHRFQPSKVRTLAFPEREGVKTDGANLSAGGYR